MEKLETLCSEVSESGKNGARTGQQKKLPKNEMSKISQYSITLYNLNIHLPPESQIPHYADRDAVCPSM